MKTATQRQHIAGTEEFEAKAAKVATDGKYAAQSVLTIPEPVCQRLIDKYAGKGEAKLTRRGTWSGREVCDAGYTIGYIIDGAGNRIYTSRFTIHYAKNGVHIVPARPKEGGQQWS